MFKIEEIIKATSGVLVRGDKQMKVGGVSTDTRTLQKGELFVAVRGDKFDGHDFLKEAVEKGASVLLISSMVSPACLERSKISRGKNDIAIIEVEDTIKAFGDLAGFHRARLNAPVIAITGSNGKTTTKDMAFSVLAKKYNVLKNEGTFNNHIGVPATILKAKSVHEAVVLELGTNHPGEIAYLAKIAKPTCGIITNIGLSHMEFFMNQENVLKEKMDIFKYFSKDNVAILNGDDELLRNAKLDPKKVFFGTDPKLDVYAADIKTGDGHIEYLLNGKDKIRLNVYGMHNISNSLAAIACAKHLGVGIKDIQSALEEFKPPKMRMEKVLVNDILLINDAYNANPKSMRLGIETLQNLSTQGKRILVAADMLELGKEAPGFHYEIGALAAESGLDYLLAVGELSKNIYEGAKAKSKDGFKAMWFKTAKEAAESLLKIAKPKDAILVKGSRAMKMEEVVQCFTTYYTR